MQEIDKAKIHSEIFWSQVEKAWPETTVVNKKEITLGEPVKICVVLCPLYSPGSLDESALLIPPATIKDSRIANKLIAYFATISAMKGYSAPLAMDLKLEVIFSNKGVLFAGEPGEGEKDILSYHKDLYWQAFYNFCRENKMSMHFSDYDDWEVTFPIFVDPNAPIPQELVSLAGAKDLPESRMISQLNAYLDLPTSIEDTKRNRHALERVLNMKGLGYNAAFWLIAGYLVFDHKISDIIGPNGVYLAAERFEPLFGIARLTKSLKELTRIQLKA